MGFLQQNSAPETDPELAAQFDNAFGVPAAAPGPVPIPGATQGTPPNILAAIGGTGAPQSTAPVAQKKRASVLDILGALADAGAEFGGAAPGYRQGVERIQKQQNDELDRAWEQKFNTQKLRSGDNTLQEQSLAKFGQAARGLTAIFQTAGAPGVAKAFPAIVQTLGLSPEEAQIFGTSLNADPQGTLEMLQAATDPTASGSQPKEMTIYRMLQKQDRAAGTDLATDYMKRVASGQTEQMNPYQAAQIETRRIDDAREDRRDRREEQRDRRDYRLRERELEIKEEKAAAGGSGGADLTPTQRGNVNMKLRTIPTLKAQVARVKQLNAELTAEGSRFTGFVGGRIPGNVAGGKAAQYDNAVAQLRSTIRQFTRTPGEGSISDYETRLNSGMLPERDQADAGRLEGIAGLEQLVNGIETGYKDMVGTPAARKPSGSSSKPGTVRRRLTPRAAGSAPTKRLKYNPATGRIE